MSPRLSTGWPAPAKVNLFLHITGRRTDGYHLLQTVFQFLDLCDRIDFELREDGRILRAEGPADLPVHQDLTMRAAQLLKDLTGVAAGAAIHLRKMIPTQAGLGGGSSDAATALVALNELWGTGLSAAELANLGLKLGADVPVFLRGESAWAEGIGEVLSPLELPEPWYLVIQPPCQVATREIFQAPELTRNSAPITIAGFRAGAARNDFEPVVRARYPAVAKALDWLGKHGEARLTGSGACVFAAFADESRARQVAAMLPHDWRSFVTKGCNRSLLMTRLDAERSQGIIGA